MEIVIATDGGSLIARVMSLAIFFSDDFAKSSRNLTSACLNVYTKSNLVEMDGKEVNIGNPKDLFAQV